MTHSGLCAELDPAVFVRFILISDIVGVYGLTHKQKDVTFLLSENGGNFTRMLCSLFGFPGAFSSNSSACVYLYVHAKVYLDI